MNALRFQFLKDQTEYMRWRFEFCYQNSSPAGRSAAAAFYVEKAAYLTDGIQWKHQDWTWFSDPNGTSEHLGILQSVGPVLEEMLEILHLPKGQHDFEAGVLRNSPSKNFTELRKAE
jgi:hypothetical protein